MVVVTEIKLRQLALQLPTLPMTTHAVHSALRHAEQSFECACGPRPLAGTGLDARALQKKFLEEAGVATIAGTSFGRFGEGYIRFSYANSTENIERALERIRACLSET